MAKSSLVKNDKELQDLVLISRNLEVLSKQLTYELKKFNELAYSIKTFQYESLDENNNKINNKEESIFEEDGFTVITKINDNHLRIDWKLEIPKDQEKELLNYGSVRVYKEERSSLPESYGEYGNLLVETKKVSGKIIDYEIEEGKSYSYSFTEDSSIYRFTRNIKILLYINRTKNDTKLSTKEIKIIEQEKIIMEAEGVLYVFEEIERKRKERIDKIESMDVSREEKENMKKLTNRVYADVASSRVKW